MSKPNHMNAKKTWSPHYWSKMRKSLVVIVVVFNSKSP